MTDPEIGKKFESEPSSRAAIRKRAQDAARAELSADRVLAGLGSRGQLARLSKTQEQIGQHPANANGIREALSGRILAGLSDEQRKALESFNKRASTDPAEFDPLGVTRRQLGAKPDASLLSLLLKAGSFGLAGDSSQGRDTDGATTQSEPSAASHAGASNRVGLTSSPSTIEAVKSAIRDIAGNTAFGAADVASGGELRKSVDGLGGVVKELPGLFDAIGSEFKAQQKKFMDEHKKSSEDSAKQISKAIEAVDNISTLLDGLNTSLS